MPAGCKAVSFLGLVLPWVLALTGWAWPQNGSDTVPVAPDPGPNVVATVARGISLGLSTYAKPIRKTVDLVLVPVTITDGLNRLVVGLRQDHFQVFEGRKAQAIAHFSSEDAPVSIGILLDVSGSMRYKMDRAQEAVRRFCEAANPQDEFFLITFASGPSLVAGFTPRPEEVENKLLFAAARGETSLLDAIYMGIGKMREAKYPRKALLIISDGGDNHSRYTESEVKSAVREADVVIYAVGTYDRYFPTLEERLGPLLLNDVAEVTGGQAFTLDNPNDLPAVVARVGVALRNQYVLAYHPQDTPRDGKWHKIKVKLRMPKLAFLHVHAKAGYYAGSE
jgi:Ca-activated chloride channel family protein